MSPDIADNVVAAWRRRGYRQGLDESKGCCYLLCIIRDCTPACAKLRVGGSAFFLFPYFFTIYKFSLRFQSTLCQIFFVKTVLTVLFLRIFSR